MRTCLRFARIAHVFISSHDCMIFFSVPFLSTRDSLTFHLFTYGGGSQISSEANKKVIARNSQKKS